MFFARFRYLAWFSKSRFILEAKAEADEVTYLKVVHLQEFSFMLY